MESAKGIAPISPSGRLRPAGAVRAQRLALLIGLAALPWLAGCLSIDRSSLQKAAYLARLSGGSALSVRRTPSNPLEDELNLLGWKGPKPSDRTIQTLRRFGLEGAYRNDPKEAFDGLRQAALREPRLETTYALAEVAYVLGKRAASAKRTEDAMRYYGESLVTSYEYLFDPKFEPYRNAYDPQFRGICDLYNVSLEEILRLMSDDGMLQPGQLGSIRLAERDLTFTVRLEGRWADYEVERFQFVSDFEVEGLANRYRGYGLGVPLIAVRKRSERPEPDEKYFPEGLTFPVTAFFRRVDDPNVAGSGECRCVLELFDPLDRSDVQIGMRRAPLESDITTPLAYYLNDPVVGTSTLATFALLDANFAQDFEGLYMLEPFDPTKIPVVMVHGLWSSPVTWMEMFNDLRSMPEIRRNYQFWFYMYPSGQPFWKSAEEMRADLAEAIDTLDPRGESAPLERMVLVGHSMGGLVSRLQTIDSQDRFWQLVSDRPIDELEGNPVERQELRQVLYFHPNPAVARVITIGTPHHGSNFANGATRWLSRRFFTLPTESTELGRRMIDNNPDFFRDTDLLTITTSVDSLSPESPFLPVMLEAPAAPWVKYHNIIGVVEDRSLLAKAGLDFRQPGDGLVSLASARVEDVESELVVPAEHMSVHQHPLAILEVRRILLQHLAEGAMDVRVDRSIMPAEHQMPAQIDERWDRPAGSIVREDRGTGDTFPDFSLSFPTIPIGDGTPSLSSGGAEASPGRIRFSLSDRSPSISELPYPDASASAPTPLDPFVRPAGWQSDDAEGTAEASTVPLPPSAGPNWLRVDDGISRPVNPRSLDAIRAAGNAPSAPR